MSVAQPARRREGFASDLLAWYDRHARMLPWRVPPNSHERPDPYRVWLSEVMLQQTTVATVRPRYERFLGKWPTVHALAAASLDDVLSEWAGLGYYARARNLHACAKIVSAEGWPTSEEGLRELPGLGAYTAASVAAIAFGRRAVVVDGNVERVVVRVLAIERPVKEAAPEIRAGADWLTPEDRPGDYAQAMMDLGATICRPNAPDCLICPVRTRCEAAERGLTREIPVRVPRKPRPIRRGVVYVGFNAVGEVLCERRPPRGLYGGMAGLPGSEWTEEGGEAPPPSAADWREVGTAKHGLTHFVLELKVRTATVRHAPQGLLWTDQTELPKVFRKCVELCRQGECSP